MNCGLAIMMVCVLQKLWHWPLLLYVFYISLAAIGCDSTGMGYHFSALLLSLWLCTCTSRLKPVLALFTL